MKRILLFLLAASLLLLSVTSCGKKASKFEFPAPTPGQLNGIAPASILTDGAAWFATVGFTSGLSDAAFKDVLSGFSYRGQSLIDFSTPRYFNNDQGKGFRGNHADLNYGCVTASSGVAGLKAKTSSLTTRVEIENLNLPWGITMDDTLPQVLEKIGLELDVDKDFVADSGSKTKMTLLSSETAELTLNDLSRNTSAMYQYPYSLSFGCGEILNRGEDDEVMVTYMFSFNFTQSTKTLSEIYITMQETTHL